MGLMAKQVVDNSRQEGIIMVTMEVVTTMGGSSLKVHMLNLLNNLLLPILMGVMIKVVHMVVVPAVQVLHQQLRQPSMVRDNKAKTTISMVNNNNLDMDKLLMDLVPMEINSINSLEDLINHQLVV